MEEKIIREKNRTSLKKIANDDDRLKEQKKVEVVDCGMWSGCRLEPWRLWSSCYGAGLLGEDQKKKGKIERKKNKLINIRPGPEPRQKGHMPRAHI